MTNRHAEALLTDAHYIEALLAVAQEASGDDPDLGMCMLLVTAASLCTSREIFLDSAQKAFNIVNGEDT